MDAIELREFYNQNGRITTALCMGDTTATLLEIACIDEQLILRKNDPSSNEWYELLKDRPRLAHLCPRHQMLDWKWGMLICDFPEIMQVIDTSMFSAQSWEHMLDVSDRLTIYVNKHNLHHKILGSTQGKEAK